VPSRLARANFGRYWQTFAPSINFLSLAGTFPIPSSQGKRIGKKKKTTVKSCNLNPYWNESFVFVIDEMDMKRVFIDMTVSE